MCRGGDVGGYMMTKLKGLVQGLVNTWYMVRFPRALRFRGARRRVRIRRGLELTRLAINGGKLTVLLGEHVYVEQDVWIKGSAPVSVGDRTIIGRRCVIGCNAGVSIGNNVLIAENVSIRDTDHRFDGSAVPIRDQGITCAPVVIGDNVWIGYGAVITKGVRVGAGSVVGANSVVTRDVPANAIVVGAPARKIRDRIEARGEETS